MNLNLSDTLSEPFRTIETDVPVEMEYFRSSLGCFQVSRKESCHIKVEHMNESGKKPVSYTHLDVYKRQV